MATDFNPSEGRQEAAAVELEVSQACVYADLRWSQARVAREPAMAIHVFMNGALAWLTERDAQT
jgi:hypothetical protein